MNKFIVFIAIASCLAATGCIKQLEKTYTGKTVAEIDATVLNSTATGVNYPILTRKPRQGFQVATSDSTLRRLSGTVSFRVNLVGPQSSKEETIGYKVFGSPVTSVSFPATASGQTPSQAAGTLTVTNAVVGTHYAALSGQITIPANSSYGYLDVQILNAGAAVGQARFLGIKLDSSGSIMPSPNYLQLGLVIDQR